MEKIMKVAGMMLLAILLSVFDVYGMNTQVITLSDKTIEQPQIGYSNNPQLENLEYWFEKNGITNENGSAIHPILDQSQAELFYTDTARDYEIEYLGIGYASYHSLFGVFTYNGDPYGPFDATKLTFYDPLFVQNEVTANSKFTFSMTANTYFGFYLDSNGTGTKLTTMVANNPNPIPTSNVVNKDDYTNGFDHTIFFRTNKGYTISFEDIVGAGDADWEDLVVNFKPVDFNPPGNGFAPESPEPATVLLLGVGIIGLVGIRKKFRQQRITS